MSDTDPSHYTPSMSSTTMTDTFTSSGSAEPDAPDNESRLESTQPTPHTSGQRGDYNDFDANNDDAISTNTSTRSNTHRSQSLQRSRPHSSTSSTSVALSAMAPLPSFASPAVVSLDASIQKKREKLFATVQTIESIEKRIEVMQNHLKHVQSEYSHTSSISQSQLDSLERESHMKLVIDRSIGKLQQQIRDVNRELNSETQAITTLDQTKIALQSEVVLFQQRAQMSSEQLVNWSLAAKQKEEDRLLMLEYSTADGKALAERRQIYQNLLSTLQEKRNKLQSVITQSNELVMASQALQSEYNREHTAKIKLLNDWDASVKLMHSKDEILIDLSDRIIEYRTTAQEHELKNSELFQFLQQEETNNKKLLLLIDENERKNGKKRDEWKLAKESIIGLEDSVLNKRSVLEKVESDHRQAKQRFAASQQRRQQSERKKELAAKLLVQRQQELETEMMTLKTVENQNQHLNAKLKVAQEEETEINKSLLSTKSQLFKMNEQLTGARTRETGLIGHISNAVNTSRMLQGKIRELDQRALKQQETLYQIEYLIQGLERKKAMESGQKSEEEKEMLTKQLRELENEYAVERSELTVIESEVRHVNDEHRLLIKIQEKLIFTRNNLTKAINEISVSINAMERELLSSQNELSGMNVSHDRAKLEFNRVSARLYTAQGALQRAELTEGELDLEMKERLSIIANHMDLKRMELKQSCELKSLESKELTQRKQALKLLETKYSAIRAKFVGSDGMGYASDDDNASDERQSQGYYIVQAGLKREELLSERERLRNKLKDLEQQIEGVTRVTLEMAAINNSSNGSHSVSRGGLESELHECQTKLSLIESELFQARNRESNLSHELESSKHILASLINEIAMITNSVNQQENKLMEVDKLQENQIKALKRAKFTTSKRQTELLELLKSVYTTPVVQSKQHEEEKTTVSSRPTSKASPRNAVNTSHVDSEMELLQLSLKVQETRRRNAVWKELLCQFAMDHDDANDCLQSLCEMTGLRIDLPQTRPSSSVSSIVSNDLTPMSARSTASSKSDISVSSVNVNSTVFLPPIGGSRPTSNSSVSSSARSSRLASQRSTVR